MFKFQVLLCCFVGLCAAKQVYFSSCGYGGFSCSTIEKHRQTITYRCPSDENDILFAMNDFKSPANVIIFLIIENCKDLTVSFRCSSEEKYISSLTIQNVEALKIQHGQQYQNQLPVKVVLENITYVESIPSFAFSQIDRNSHNDKCFKSVIDLKVIHLKNVRVGSVESNGIHIPNNSSNIFFKNVTIDKLKGSAVLANMSYPHIFSMENSTVGVIDRKAIQVTGKGIIISGNTLGRIAPKGIDSRVENFFFFKNNVGTLQPHAISTSSQEILIWDNTFKDMKSGSLEKIRLGIPPSNILVGNFTYKFFFNTIHHMDNGCLHPANGAVDILPTDLFVANNRIPCSCDDSAWLFSIFGQGNDINPQEKFYTNFLDINSNNHCHSSCNLPVRSTKKMIKNEECDESITAEWLCQHQT